MRAAFLLLSTSFGTTLTLFGIGAASGMEDDPPNVLLIYVDDLNRDLGTYGHPIVQSPNIDALANEGIRFDNAYCTMALCTPSRISLLSGLRVSTFKYYSNWDRPVKGHEISGVPMLPYRFRSEGYTTGGIGKILHTHYADPGSWDEYFDAYDDPWIEQPEEPGDPLQIYWGPFRNGADDSAGKMRDTKYTDAGIDMIQRFEEPWFITVGYLGPHRPFVYPERYESQYPPADVPPLPFEEYRGDWKEKIHHEAWLTGYHIGPQWEDDPEQGRREATAAYWRSITFIDDEIGRLMTSLDESGRGERTVVVFVSDHGFSLGRHDRWNKSSLFDDDLLTPMIMRVPGWEPGAVKRPVEQIDVYPTLMELCGLETPSPVEGDSLAPLVRSEPPKTKPVFSVTVGRLNASIQRIVRTERYKFVYWEDGRHLLFDLKNDPCEYNNLYGNPAYDAIVDEHRFLLEERGFLKADWHRSYTGLRGTNGIPEFYPSRFPFMGETIELVQVSSSPKPEPALVLWGLFAAHQSALGGFINVQPMSISPFILQPGTTRIPFDVPTEPHLRSTSVVSQILQMDAGAPQRVAFSAGLRLFFYPR